MNHQVTGTVVFFRFVTIGSDQIGVGNVGSIGVGGNYHCTDDATTASNEYR